MIKHSIIFLSLIAFNATSAEITIISNSRSTYKEFNFTDNSKYSIIEQLGQWTDSIGNYGSTECLGLIKKDDQDTIKFLDVTCEMIDQNNIVTWRKFERVGSEIERGVGVSTIIDTTSKYRDSLIGTKCKYAVNRTKDMVFSKAVCDISEELLRKLSEH